MNEKKNKKKKKGKRQRLRPAGPASNCFSTARSRLLAGDDYSAPASLAVEARQVTTSPAHVKKRVCASVPCGMIINIISEQSV